MLARNCLDGRLSAAHWKQRRGVALLLYCRNSVIPHRHGEHWSELHATSVRVSVESTVSFYKLLVNPCRLYHLYHFRPPIVALLERTSATLVCLCRVSEWPSVSFSSQEREESRSSCLAFHEWVQRAGRHRESYA